MLLQLCLHPQSHVLVLVYLHLELLPRSHPDPLRPFLQLHLDRLVASVFRPHQFPQSVDSHLLEPNVISEFLYLLGSDIIFLVYLLLLHLLLQILNRFQQSFYLLRMHFVDGFDLLFGVGFVLLEVFVCLLLRLQLHF